MATRKKTQPKKATKATARKPEAQKVIAEFRTIINAELRKVTADTHPIIYGKIQNQAGYRLLEEDIITMCLRNGITPSAAIAQWEATMEETL